MIWSYLFPEEEQDSQQRQVVLGMSTIQIAAYKLVQVTDYTL